LLGSCAGTRVPPGPTIKRFRRAEIVDLLVFAETPYVELLWRSKWLQLKEDGMTRTVEDLQFDGTGGL